VLDQSKRPRMLKKNWSRFGKTGGLGRERNRNALILMAPLTKKKDRQAEGDTPGWLTGGADIVLAKTTKKRRED